jgi:superfamily II DNA or RNA helicase
VHGGTELAVRQQIFADFKSGKLNAITNCNVLTEVSLIVYA